MSLKNQVTPPGIVLGTELWITLLKQPKPQKQWTKTYNFM